MSVSAHHGLSLTWQGFGASPGKTAGRAEVIRTERDIAAPRDSGDVIVAFHATPTLYPLLLRARAAVCETGGLLCHLAILARELGKPCVTGVAGIVDSVKTGDWISVDGSSGQVSVGALGRAIELPKDNASREPFDYLQVMQFGVFSTTFEYADPHFDLHIAVSISALISLLTVLSAGEELDYIVTERNFLVAAQPFKETLDSLADRLEDGTLTSANLLKSYTALSEDPCWPALAAETADLSHFRYGLSQYFQMSRTTWAAAAAKNVLTSRYWTFISQSLPKLDELTRRTLFLHALIMPGLSYILTSQLENTDHKWSAGLSAAAQLNTSDLEASRLLMEGSQHQRQIAIEELKTLLDRRRFMKAQDYIASLTDLVEITERKNTDLHKCESLLFGSEIRAAMSAEALGLQWSNVSYDDDSRRRMISKVLEALTKGRPLPS